MSLCPGGTQLSGRLSEEESSQAQALTGAGGYATGLQNVPLQL